MSFSGAIAFQIGPIVIRWYGHLMANVDLVGSELGYRQAKREGAAGRRHRQRRAVAILAASSARGSTKSAFNWDYYGPLSVQDRLVWEGGLAMHGRE